MLSNGSVNLSKMFPENTAHCFRKATFVIPSTENNQKLFEQLEESELQSFKICLKMCTYLWKG